jgi:hypothetical protein
MKRLVSWTNVALGGYERDCQLQVTKARLPSRPSAEGGVEERHRGGKDKRAAGPYSARAISRNAADASAHALITARSI